MSHLHNSIRHLKYLRQSLSQDSESIGFFVSAGCPLSIPMPSGSWPLIPDVANLTKYINEQLKEDGKYSQLLMELGKASGRIENIEEILSFIRGLLSVSKGGEVRGFSEPDLLELESKICYEIVKKIDVNLPDEDTPYHKLCKWIRSIDRKVAIEIFTTNYDLLMEQALEELEVPYFDGFVGARKPFFDLRALEDNLIPAHWSRLWKIHGSINWHQENLVSGKRVFRSAARKEESSHLIYPSHLKYEESRKMPYLALMDQLNRFIRRKSSFLIISGYSFGDGHINDIILGALKSNPTAMVLGLMHGSYMTEPNVEGIAQERYPEAYRLAKNQHNLNIWTFDKAIIGTNLGDWVRFLDKEEDVDINIARFSSLEKIKIDEEEKTVNFVKLGDFALLAGFLQAIIGTKQEV